jgi:hypothetical protein
VCGSPTFQAPIEVAVEAMERMENAGQALRTEAKAVRKLLTISLEDIERPYGKGKDLREKWMYRKYRFLSNSKLVW